MEQEEFQYKIREAKPDEWYDAMALAWRTFLKYEADDYSEAGVKSFREFITDNFLHRMFISGNYKLYLAVEGEKILGIISLRESSHISLLFVDEKYHFHGIGKSLIHHLSSVVDRKRVFALTVNASPYGVGFYHKVGFKDSASEVEKDGIRYTPMVLQIS